MLEKIKRYQFLFTELVKRDFTKKYKRTMLGMAWSILSPLIRTQPTLSKGALTVLPSVFTPWCERFAYSEGFADRSTEVAIRSNCAASVMAASCLMVSVGI